jgi:hypothetical protein
MLPPEEHMSENGKEGRPSSRATWIVFALAVVAAAALVALWVRQRPATPPAAVPAATPPAPSPSTPPPGPAPTVDADRVRSLLESVSTNALFRRWLAEGDLVRRWVVVTDNLAEGVTPRKQLGFLAPSRAFSVVERGDKSIIAPDSYRRYDDFADAVISVDAQVLAKVYRELHPVVEAAYRALGYPGASLDHVTARALHRIEAAPVKQGEVLVERQGVTFVFADSRLENLGQVEKHLLRMGPRNTLLLQAKAREIQQALGLPAATGGAGYKP